jgi:hypothetical protein
MMSELKKRAILLRGPIGVGKSEVQTALLSRFRLPPQCAINLDDGWDWRYRFRQSERYPELCNRPEHILIIELSCGEPEALGLRMDGATRSPREWIDILEQDGRQLHAFTKTNRMRPVTVGTVKKSIEPITET